jgi:hypothetical protein
MKNKVTVVPDGDEPPELTGDFERDARLILGRELKATMLHMLKDDAYMELPDLSPIGGGSVPLPDEPCMLRLFMGGNTLGMDLLFAEFPLRESIVNADMDETFEFALENDDTKTIDRAERLITELRSIADEIAQTLQAARTKVAD